MRDTESDGKLDLRELGGTGASPGFTGRVLEALDARVIQRRQAARRRALGISALALAAALAVFWIARPGERTAALAPEARTAPLLTQSDEVPRVLYLGEMDGYELVLDLGPLLEEPLPGQVRPAAFTGEPRRD